MGLTRLTACLHSTFFKQIYMGTMAIEKKNETQIRHLNMVDIFARMFNYLPIYRMTETLLCLNNRINRCLHIYAVKPLSKNNFFLF